MAKIPRSSCGDYDTEYLVEIDGEITAEEKDKLRDALDEIFCVNDMYTDGSVLRIYTERTDRYFDDTELAEYVVNTIGRFVEGRTVRTTYEPTHNDFNFEECHLTEKCDTFRLERIQRMVK